MGRRGPLARAKDKDGQPIRGTAVIVGGPVAPAAAPADIPPCPSGVLASSRRTWEEFWSSRAATWVDRGSAMARLRRWIHDVDQYQRILNDMQPGVRPGLIPGTSGPPDDWPVDEPWAGAPGPDEELEPQPHGGSLKRRRQIVELVRDPDGVPGVFDGRRPWLGLGSTGQITTHPSAAMLEQLDARIHRAEVEFGMTPYAAVRLGLAGVQGALTAEQLRELLTKREGAQPELDAPWAAGLRPA